MKIGMVKHIRCGEDTYDRTLVWLPDDMTAEEFEAAIAAARAEYLAFVARFKDEAAPESDYRPHRMIPYGKYPTETVAAVEAAWAIKKAAYEAWDAERKQARKTLGAYLNGRSGIELFYQFEPPFTCECDWGHQHGVELQYDESDAT